MITLVQRFRQDAVVVVGILCFLVCQSFNQNAMSLAMSSNCANLDDPPCNPFLAQKSPWAISHSSSYGQGSSSLPGPRADDDVQSTHINILGIPAMNLFSPPYMEEGDDDNEDGMYALWSVISGVEFSVMKFNPHTMTIIDHYVVSEREDNPDNLPPLTLPDSVSGVYSLMTDNFEFITAGDNTIAIYSDDSPTPTLNAKIKLVERIPVPLCSTTDAIVGFSMLYTGELAVLTVEGGVIVVVLSAPTEVDGTRLSKNITHFDSCGSGVASNNIVVDENNGIYSLTSQDIRKHHYDSIDEEIVHMWNVPYKSDEEALDQAIRLGPGSGSSPSLMGGTMNGDMDKEEEQDKLIVITDGQVPMNLVFAWRDEIPDDWIGLEGLDRRVACEIPVTFGLENKNQSISEQSVLVRGYSAIAVNNYLRNQDFKLGLASFDAVAGILAGSDPNHITPGIERIDWDPETRTCKSIWTNNEIYSPNGIPTMSSTTGLVYVIVFKNNTWGLQSIDYETGDAVTFWPATTQECDEEALTILKQSVLAALLPKVRQYPSSCQNSAYAATEIGHDGSIYTGTFNGLTKYWFIPKEDEMDDQTDAPIDDSEIDGQTNDDGSGGSEESVPGDVETDNSGSSMNGGEDPSSVSTSSAGKFTMHLSIILTSFVVDVLLMTIV